MCFGVAAAQTSEEPWIEFTMIPSYGTSEYLEGRVGNVAPGRFQVALYVEIDNRWWSRPTLTERTVPVADDGTWRADITAGDQNLYATEIAAFLLPAGIDPPPVDGITYVPDPPEAVASLRTYCDPNTRFIDFKGYRWRVKGSDRLTGPGPNLFSDRPEDVWVDESGLHLTIRPREGGWWCTEVVLTQSLGYGTYMFQTQSRIDLFDPSIVAAFFTWVSDAPSDRRREFDIEFSRWGDSGRDKIVRYIIQPCSDCSDQSECCVDFPLDLSEGPTGVTYRVRWEPGRLSFLSTRESSAENSETEKEILNNWDFTGDLVPEPGGETVRINFWLYRGVPPADGQPAEFVVADFRFLPLTYVNEWGIYFD